ncbi:DUF3619 family protein [Candidatus Methylopumilus turicensis]|nr:DUF3619 family protein [Candidatus Methylopumilus turicensis]
MMKLEQKNLELQDEQLAKKIALMLNKQCENIDESTASKLNYARQQALAKMAKSPSGMSISQNGMLVLLGGYWHQYRLLMTVMMGGLGLVALLTLQNMTNQEVYGQEDADLLSSDLPPEAYLNEAFDTWLSQNAS